MAVGNRTRFEVLKRDRFTCRYCGKKAFVDPEVLLEVREFKQPGELQVDHVEPRSKGGSDDLINLVTACVRCNSGKSDVPLADDAALRSQAQRLEELAAHKEQLRMMLEWKKGLRSEFEERLVVFEQYWSDLLGGSFSLNENGRKNLKSLLRNRSGWTDEDILEAMEIAVDQYVDFDEDDKPIQESVELAWKRVKGICRNRKKAESKPYWEGVLYTRGILRNRLSYMPGDVLDYIEQAHLAGISIETLQGIAKDSTSWQGSRGFEPAVEALLEAGDVNSERTEAQPEETLREDEDYEANRTNRPDVVEAFVNQLPSRVREEYICEGDSAAERLSSVAYSLCRHSPVWISQGCPNLRNLNELLEQSVDPEEEGAFRTFLYSRGPMELVGIRGDAVAIADIVRAASQMQIGEETALEVLESCTHLTDSLFRESLLGGLVRRVLLERLGTNADVLREKLDNFIAVFGRKGALELLDYMPHEREACWRDVQSITRHIIRVPIDNLSSHLQAAQYLEVMKGYSKPFDAVAVVGETVMFTSPADSWTDFAASEVGAKTLEKLRIAP